MSTSVTVAPGRQRVLEQSPCREWTSYDGHAPEGELNAPGRGWSLTRPRARLKAPRNVGETGNRYQVHNSSYFRSRWRVVWVYFSAVNNDLLLPQASSLRNATAGYAYGLYAEGEGYERQEGEVHPGRRLLTDRGEEKVQQQKKKRKASRVTDGYVTRNYHIFPPECVCLTDCDHTICISLVG